MGRDSGRAYNTCSKTRASWLACAAVLWALGSAPGYAQEAPILETGPAGTAAETVAAGTAAGTAAATSADAGAGAGSGIRAGERQLVVQKPGYTTMLQSLHLRAGQRRRFALTSERRFTPWKPWALAGGGAAVGVAGALAWWLSDRDGDRLRDEVATECAREACRPSSLSHSWTRIQWQERVGTAAAVVGGSALVSGVVMIVWNRQRQFRMQWMDDGGLDTADDTGENIEASPTTPKFVGGFGRQAAGSCVAPRLLEPTQRPRRAFLPTPWTTKTSPDELRSSRTSHLGGPISLLPTFSLTPDAATVGATLRF